MRRFTRHALLAAFCAAGTLAVALLFPDGIRVFRLSLGTAYASLALLSASLLLGPANVLLGRPNPVSTDLRRDFGIWAALSGVAHVVFGLQVHMPGKPWQYFLWPSDEDHLLPFRYDAAGVSNYPGLAATGILILLLALSNDAALRGLGTGRWKALQRWNYAGFAFMAFHGVIYQILEKRSAPWVVVFGLFLVIVAATQAAAWRRRRAEGTRGR